MRLSVAKALVRQYFYRDFLPSQLPAPLIQRGNYLVLLGADLEEAQLLGELGVPSRNIYSVENQSSVFRQQMDQIESGNLRASTLYFGELATFIRHHLYTNQRFQVLNLDICGSYLHHIDPVMDPMMLFARRNPTTVISTYTNVGRDQLQLGEGLKSLALFLWLSPDVTTLVAETLYARYKACGMRSATAFTMVLRHMFWVRSHLEHILTSHVMIGPTRPAVARNILETFEEFWEKIRKQLRQGFTYADFTNKISKHVAPKLLPLALDLSIQQVTVATYEAIDIAYHTAWFCTYQRVHLMEPVEWAEQALLSLIASPLLFADNIKAELRQIDGMSNALPPKLVVSNKVQLVSGRKVVVPKRSRQFTALRSTAPAIVAKPAPAILQPSRLREEVKTPMTKKVPPKKRTDITSTISPTELVRLLAGQGYSTKDIAQMVPSVKRSSIAAFVANANRKRK